MANAIKKISVQRGYDVTRYALNCFGGAGGQHACLVADALGMTSVLIHPLSSLLSAYGMGLADIRSVRQQAIEETFGAQSTQVARKRRDTARRRYARRSHRPGRCRRQNQSPCARPYPVRRNRHRAHCRGRHGRWTRQDQIRFARKNESGFRAGAQSAVRLHRPPQGTRDRGGIRGSRRRWRDLLREAAQDHPRETPRAGAADALLLRRQVAPRAGVHTRYAVARPQGEGPRHHHRAAPDRRGRARLAGRTYGQEPSRAASACRSSHASARSAPMPIR